MTISRNSIKLINVNDNGLWLLIHDPFPLAMGESVFWDRGSSGTHGRVVAWSSMSKATAKRSGETFEEGSESIGAMVLAAIVRNPRGRRRITRYLLTTAYTQGHPLLTLPRASRSIYSRPTFSAFIRRSVDGRGHFYFHCTSLALGFDNYYISANGGLDNWDYYSYNRQF